MLKKKWSLFIFLLGFVLFLAACSDDAEDPGFPRTHNEVGATEYLVAFIHYLNFFMLKALVTFQQNLIPATS